MKAVEVEIYWRLDKFDGLIFKKEGGGGGGGIGGLIFGMLIQLNI